jgi:hypothetical protein
VLPTDGGYECKNGGSTQSCGSGGSDCVQCQFGCDRDGGGHCTGCAPDCSGKSCGSDGCGGSCGSCAVGKMCVGGSCQCANAGPELGDIACSNGIDDDCNGQTDCADAGCAAARCANMAPGQFCRQGICSSGCRIGAQIFAAGAVNPANSCQSCQPNVDDSAWTALTDGSPCLDASLENGQCHSAACCIRCWDGQGCRDSNASHCGLGGVACVNCVDANPCTANLCSNGTCSNPPLADGTLCHATTCANGAGCPGCGPSTPSTTCRLGDACQGGVCSMAVVGIGCCDGVNSNCCVTAGSSMCCP